MGVAPDAKIAVFQFLDSPQSTDILIDQASGNFDIFNYSYGDELYYDTLSSTTYVDFLRYKVLNGRNGKGTIYVKAAGNEFNLANSDDICASHNANAPFENEAPWMIIVGAINADGVKATYSNAGSNLWIAAPGGEYGTTEPALITTDLPTCFKGYSKATSAAVNDFEYGHALNTKCNYTSVMNGTSGATPIISGVIALMLQANPNLSWRDVKHILASTADQVDTVPASFAHPSLYYTDCTNIGLTNHTYEQGWVPNNAGVKFHNYYGFGVVNALAAVQMAKSMTGDALSWLPMPAMVELNNGFTDTNYTSTPAVNIPDADEDGVTDTISVASSINVETVQVKVKVTHPRSGQIGVELTSPSNTKSILLNINNSFLFSNDSNLNIVLTSNAFYGETANGVWSLKVIDGLSGHTGQLDKWDINIIGHN